MKENEIKGSNRKYRSYPYTAAVEGLHECAIVLYDEEGNVLVSPRFVMIVNDRVIGNDNVELSDENKMILDSMITEEAFRQNAETERADAEAGSVRSKY